MPRSRSTAPLGGSSTRSTRLALGELLAMALGGTSLDQVFPGYAMPAFRGIYR